LVSTSIPQTGSGAKSWTAAPFVQAGFDAAHVHLSQHGLPSLQLHSPLAHLSQQGLSQGILEQDFLQAHLSQHGLPPDMAMHSPLAHLSQQGLSHDILEQDFLQVHLSQHGLPSLQLHSPLAHLSQQPQGFILPQVVVSAMFLHAGWQDLFAHFGPSCPHLPQCAKAP